MTVYDSSCLWNILQMDMNYMWMKFHLFWIVHFYYNIHGFDDRFYLFHSQELIIVCHKAPIMLIWRIWYWINSKSHWYFSLFSLLVCMTLYGYCKEKFNLDHSWELRVNAQYKVEMELYRRSKRGSK